MIHPQAIVGVALALLALALRAFHRNRHVRVRLTVSALALIAGALASAALSFGVTNRGLEEDVALALPLLFAFGVVNGAVALVINPWRHDRMPDRFPTIVQDAIVIALFAVAATAVLKERVFATTAVGAVVIGFALQDTLGNLFAGLAIQVEKPFRVGHWIRVAGTDAVVDQITWRATKLRTKTGNLLSVPNSVIARDTVLNYSEPLRQTMLEIDVGASYDVPPNRVKAVILDAVQHEQTLAADRPTEVLVTDFAASAIIYRIRIWTSDFASDEYVRDRVRTAVYYAFGRAGISIPYPTEVQIQKQEAEPRGPRTRDAETALGRVALFTALSPKEHAELARSAKMGLYPAGCTVVRQGEPGDSMFVVVAGEVVVAIEPSNREVARIGTGGVFGEMSLLTGEPRQATIRTAGDAELLEIAAEDFRRFIAANPAALDVIGQAVTKRRSELEAIAAAATEPATDTRGGLIARMRRFLGLTPS